jgi:hypothetical protein
MKGKYCSVYNIKIKRYTKYKIIDILVRLLYVIILHNDNAWTNIVCIKKV